MGRMLSMAVDSTPANPRTESVWLGRLCFWLAAGGVTAWAVYRVKPVIWYGLMFGLVMVAVAAVWRTMFTPTGRWSWTLEVSLAAIFGTAASLWQADQHRATARAMQVDPVAAALMTELAQLPPGADVSQTGAEIAAVAPMSPLTRFLTQRYLVAGWSPPAWGLLCELTLAGGVAGVITAATTRSSVNPPAEGSA
jgi:hypothetical protein